MTVPSPPRSDQDKSGLFDGTCLVSFFLKIRGIVYITSFEGTFIVFYIFVLVVVVFYRKGKSACKSRSVTKSTVVNVFISSNKIW